MPLQLCACCNKMKDCLRCGGCTKVYYCSPACQRGNWSQHKAICKRHIAISKALDDIFSVVRDDTAGVKDRCDDLNEQTILLDLEIAIRGGKPIFKEDGDGLVPLTPWPEFAEYSDTDLQTMWNKLRADQGLAKSQLAYLTALLVNREQALAAHDKLSELEVIQHEQMTTFDQENQSVCYRAADRTIHKGGAAVLKLGDAMLRRYTERKEMIDALWPATPRG